MISLMSVVIRGSKADFWHILSKAESSDHVILRK